MSDALSYATAAPGVHASGYGRCLRQRDFNNASETSIVLETLSSSVVYPQKGKLDELRAPLPPHSSRPSSTDRLPKHIS